ncbi:unnamed protein product [Allacma fusca]|uniref:PiggyBac transposable element-derived protein domain-containing protein n=1 Tax=Allacma fusca TaxID=39272 RepID=A0A8J2KVJ6_9HEXA|nr:unnamed protein product [Allacma fusca]
MASSSKKTKFEPPKSGPFWAQGSDSGESSDSEDSELEDHELVSNYDQIPYPEEKSYSARDREGNAIPWSNVRQPSSRRRFFNKWEQRPGGLGLRTELPEVEPEKTRRGLFSLMMDESIIDLIVQWTNKKATIAMQTWNDQYPDKKKDPWVTDKIEILAYMGLLLMAGAHKCKELAQLTRWLQSTHLWLYLT